MNWQNPYLSARTLAIVSDTACPLMFAFTRPPRILGEPPLLPHVSPNWDTLRRSLTRLGAVPRNLFPRPRLVHQYSFDVLAVPRSLDLRVQALAIPPACAYTWACD